MIQVKLKLILVVLFLSVITTRSSFLFSQTSKVVATLVEGKFTAGFHTVTFNAAASLSSGVYFYKIVAGEFVDIKRMLLIK
jgi:hypothetical protein